MVSVCSNDRLFVRRLYVLPSEVLRFPEPLFKTDGLLFGEIPYRIEYSLVIQRAAYITLI